MQHSKSLYLTSGENIIGELVYFTDSTAKNTPLYEDHHPSLKFLQLETN